MASFATFASRWMNCISHSVFTRLSCPVDRLKRICELSFGAGQRELKYGAARLVRLRPQPAAMSVDDRSTDRQPHPCSGRLRGVERLENPLQIRRIDARPGIAHGHEDAGLVLLGADRQLSCPRRSRAHGFNRVQDEVQDHLLQLNAIAMNGRRLVSEPSLNRDAVPDDRASRQRNHLGYRRIEIKMILPRRRVSYLITNTINDASGSSGVAHDAVERLPDLAEVWRVSVQKIHGCTSVIARTGDRLRDLMRQRGGQFSHYAHAVHVGEI